MKKKLFFLVSFFVLFSCTKNDFNNELTIKDESINHSLLLSGTYYTPPYWDWENEDFINFKGANIPVPWASGASASIPLEVKNDYLKADGWELLYNTFPYAQADPVFILYNKLTGIARIFMWVTNTNYTANSFTWGFGLATYNAQTAAFNLNRATPLPYSSKLSNPNLYVHNFSSDPNVVPNGVIPNSWYSCDVELMYDPNVANLTHDNIEFCIHSFVTDKSFIKLNGTINGSINGTFTMPSAGSSSGIFSDFVKGFDVRKDGTINIGTKEETQKYIGDFIAKQLNSVFKAEMNAALTSLSSNISPTNLVIKTLSNGIINSSTSSPGKINCKIEAKTTDEGTITNITAGPNVNFLYPGSRQTTKGGILPHYNKQLGVFYIDKKPQIKNVQTSKKSGIEYLVTNDLTIVSNSFNVIINPEVSSLASSIVIEKQITFSPYITDSQILNGRLIDSRNNVNKFLSFATSLSYQYLAPRPARMIEPFKVRVTVKITPAGKTDPIILIKEFDASLIY